MPLSRAANRKLIHRRSIECQGYQREDGLWDIEACLTDTKSYSFPNSERGTVAAGEPVHKMWLRLTIDDNLLIHGSEAWTEAGPFNMCPHVNDRYAQLKDLQIGPGWSREVRKRVGGTLGCTHLGELLRTVATTAFQTVYPMKTKHESTGNIKAEKGVKPPIIDTCHALASDSEVVKQRWPDHYTGS